MELRDFDKERLEYPSNVKFVLVLAVIIAGIAIAVDTRNPALIGIAAFLFVVRSTVHIFQTEKVYNHNMNLIKEVCNHNERVRDEQARGN